MSNLISSVPEEPIVWQCEASGRDRSYRVEELDRSAPGLQVKVYGDSSYETLLETVEVTRESLTALDLPWVGRTQEGRILHVLALAKNLEFQVEDSRHGTAVGRCIRHTAFN